MKPIIKLNNINFTYNKGKDNEFRALININLDIFPEEFVVVFGPSGCGKSTLLNIIAGLETPDSGALIVFDKDMTEMTKNEFSLYHRSQVGMIYQSYNLVNTLTVLDNVALPQMFIDIRKKKREELANKLLDRFGILPQAKKIPTELSGGQQQRIGIARAIINNPTIVLADEPVGNLDSVSSRNVLEILADLNEKEKKTVVLVTHNPENLIYADRIIYMKDGLITKEIVNKDKHRDLEGKRETTSKTPTAEIMDLMRAYHGLTPEQINILILPYKSKVFAHHFISSRSLEESKIFEDVIQRRLLGTIGKHELEVVLNRPYKDGGVGFDIRTSEKIIRRIDRIIRMAYFIYQKYRQRKDEQGQHPKITEAEKVAKLTDYLLKTCFYEHMASLQTAQMERLRQSVKERLRADIQKQEFYDSLDTPLKSGGVGLNSKTAKTISEEMELILILGFGVIQLSQNQMPPETSREANQGETATMADETDLDNLTVDDTKITGKVDEPSQIPGGVDLAAVLAGQTGDEADNDRDENQTEIASPLDAEAKRILQEAISAAQSDTKDKNNI